jgi:hypothetical protein
LFWLTLAVLAVSIAGKLRMTYGAIAPTIVLGWTAVAITVAGFWWVWRSASAMAAVLAGTASAERPQIRRVRMALAWCSMLTFLATALFGAVLGLSIVLVGSRIG